jgi:hypothetical protein
MLGRSLNQGVSAEAKLDQITGCNQRPGNGINLEQPLNARIPTRIDFDLEPALHGFAETVPARDDPRPPNGAGRYGENEMRTLDPERKTRDSKLNQKFLSLEFATSA